MINKPISVYVNWASYDELSDNVQLDETIAMQQLDELLRLRGMGVKFDYYLMDCFWYDPHGGYRTWRKPHWPDGPARFLDTCLKNGVKPGLWIGGNSLAGLHPVPAWQSSMTSYNPNSLFTGSACLFYGGFLPDLLDVLEMWYQRGVRMYKFDFQHLDAAPPALRQSMLPSEIRKANEQALISGLKGLKARCPELVLIGYNGFEEADTQNITAAPFRKTIGTHWLEAFDSLYCGDPRPADVPTINFWRSKDIYSDHMVRVYEQNGFPLNRIDNAGFMIGTTGTCYNRRTAAWQGMLLLSLARGGWVNTYYGNLDLLDDEKANWFAQAQCLYYPFQAIGRTSTFGGLPGAEEAYGYLMEDITGALITAVNPSQVMQRLELPVQQKGRILFSDTGFLPVVEDGCLVLGPEQMALVGYGRCDSAELELGVQADVHIPFHSQQLDLSFTGNGPQTIIATFIAPETGSLRLVMLQQDEAGLPVRTTGGSLPNGTSLGKLLILSAEQEGQALPIQIEYDKVIWSGLSWAAGLISEGMYQPGKPVTVSMISREKRPVKLTGKVYVTIEG